MSCYSCNGGGGTQPFGRGNTVTAAVTSLATGSGWADTKWVPTQRYLYKDGPELWPPAQSGSFPRQPSNYWSYKTRECQLGCSNGFVGSLRPDNTIQCVFVGLPDHSGGSHVNHSGVSRGVSRRGNRGVSRNGNRGVSRGGRKINRFDKVDIQFRRRQQMIDNQIGVNGRATVARSQKQVQPRCTFIYCE